MAEELTFANTQITIELDSKIRAIAAQRRISRSEVVRMAIESFIAKYEVISITDLPHPPDAEPVPLVLVVPVEG